MAIDIDQSYYNTGTATVDAGGSVVTGQGTQWAAAVRPGDIFGTHVGMPVRIASVTDNTHLTLAYPWKGAAQTAAAYEIQFTPYKSGYQEAQRQLLLTLGNGNLEALAGLASDTNKVPYFTGQGTAGLATFTALARSLVAQADAASMRGAMGADDATNLIVGVLSDDRLGSYNADNTDIAGLIGGSNFGRFLTGYLNGHFAVGIRGNDIGDSFSIVSGGGDFASDPVYDKLVAQFFADGRANFPSGELSVKGRPVANSGSNANGNYVRFYDGTQICWAGGYGTQGAATPFPASFTSTPAVVAIPLVNGIPRFSTLQPGLTGTQFTMLTYSDSGGGSSNNGPWLAIGRWY